MRLCKLYRALSCATVLGMLAPLLGIMAAVIPASPARAASGNITLSVSSGPVGTNVPIVGLGFTGNTTYTVSFRGINIISGLVSSNGTFSTNFAVPASPRATHSVIVTTSNATGVVDTSNTAVFTVTPSLLLSVGSALIGDPVTVSGTGFNASLSVTVIFDITAVGAVTADLNGSFSGVAFAVPATWGGTHTVSATDSSGQAPGVGLIIMPRLTLTPSTATAGTPVSVTGNGFAAFSTMTFMFDGLVTATTATSTSIAGDFTLSNFIVPAMPGGPHVLTARDGSLSSASSSLVIQQGLAVEPTTGPAGTAVKVTGSAFSRNVPVTIRYQGTAITTTPATITTDDTGAFSASFTVPPGDSGSYTVDVSDGIFSATSAFTITAKASLSPVKGTIGSRVSVSGTGFNPGKPLTVTYDDKQLATTTVSANGTATATFTVPPSPGGDHTVTMADNANSIPLTFSVLGTASLNPTSGNVGRDVSVNGTGFAASKVLVVRYDNAQVATATANANGNFAINFKPANSQRGEHTVTITDGVTTINLPFTITPAVNLTPASGNIGSEITVGGTGLGATKPITVRFDNNQVATGNSDAAGTLSIAFKAPVSVGGNHLVSVTDGTSTVSVTFAMDSTPPPAPQLPAATTPVQAVPETRFVWPEVSDPSGVTYTLQVAKDAAFSGLVLEKKGLTSTGYTITKEEKLKSVSKRTPYYWRVRAIDGASNEGSWSNAQPFYVGLTLPGWSLYAFAGIGVILVLLFGFWLGSRRRLGGI